ncbi:hypothetical protein HNR19_004072 [Nocardioides thalensis]|uniref:Uncharacterized protein n=1 Tax=Nocardioides thalensis TaxID=1914755 RepID=A0A853C740_9ACTN|nr:hypothetical protein [Nocardioides thalensis]NYJ03374.1 hypothetical protein [Nocardioides thalensis]
MTVLRTAAVAAAALAAVAAGAVPPAAPAAAATAPTRAAVCAPLDLADVEPQQVRDYAAEVDFVFVGRVLDRRALRPQTSGLRPRTAGYIHTVTVKAALQGDVRNVVKVLTTDARATGLGPLRPRSDYLFFADEVDTDRAGALTEDRRFEALQCSGTTELDEPMTSRVERDLEQALRAPEEPGMPVELTEPDGGATEPPSLTRAIAPGVALGLVGLLGLLLFSRVGRRA